MFNEPLFVADERQTCVTPLTEARVRPEYRLICCEAGHTRRAEAEDFIRRRFLRSHGAHVASFLPTLLLLTDSHDELAAVAGFRCAAGEPLYLEKYLPVPVEQAIEARSATQPRRAEIVEIGNFAAVDSRRAKILMSFMPEFFLALPARWIVFTATASIRALLTAMGGHCLELGAADGSCVAGGADEWGRYYSNDPRVMAGFLPAARRIPALWRSRHGD